MGWLTDSVTVIYSSDGDDAVVLRASALARVMLVWPRRSEVRLDADDIESAAWVDDGWAEAIGPRGPGLQVPKRSLMATTRSRADGCRTLALVNGTRRALVIRVSPNRSRWTKVVISEALAASSAAALNAIEHRF